MPEKNVRYALYLAPPADSALWRFGSLVLGHDAETGRDLPGFELPSLHAPQWSAGTTRARTYGFHATLKAPFRLAANTHEVELVEALEDFAANELPIEALALRLAIIDAEDGRGFIALVPQAANAALSALERRAVLTFERFRAPLTDEEIARRDPAALSPRQRRNLAEFGYPYVFEDFQPHFTLSDRLPNAAQLRSELERQMQADAVKPEIEIDQLVLFRQTAPGERFRVFVRAPMKGRAGAPVPEPALTGDQDD
jgi:2'-5' RNA ligase